MEAMDEKRGGIEGNSRRKKKKKWNKDRDGERERERERGEGKREMISLLVCSI